VSELAKKDCVPCRGGVPALTQQQTTDLLRQVDGWSVEKGHHLCKAFRFPDFVQALGFVNRIGEIAEKQGHHPDLYLSWGMVRVEIWTHKIDGLTESDFVLAAKIDEAL
jgi:4a-hydroxytetrahydrobiopterin dehydratase